MVTRLAAFVVWALVAGGIVYWSLKLLVRAPTAPPHAVAAVGSAAVRGDLTRLLGAAPAAAAAVTLAPALASRFRLHGVMAPKGKPSTEPSRQGVALISVDGKPPRAYVLGARLDSNLVLQSVSLRTASIGPTEGGPTIKLEVPPMPVPATGTLPVASAAAPVPSAAPDNLVAPKAPLAAGGQVPGTAPGVAAPTPALPAAIAPRRDLPNSR